MAFLLVLNDCSVLTVVSYLIVLYYVKNNLVVPNAMRQVLN